MLSNVSVRICVTAPLTSDISVPKAISNMAQRKGPGQWLLRNFNSHSCHDRRNLCHIAIDNASDISVPEALAGIS